MGPSRSSISSDLSMSMSPTFLPPYKSEQQQQEEDVGLLSATSNRLQHIASPRFKPTQVRWHKATIFSVLLLTAFFLGGVAIAGISLVYYTQGSQDGGSRCQSSDAAGRKKVLSSLVGELNGLVPEFDVHPVVFGKDALATSDHKTEASANATEENWRSYMPAGNGFIAVDHPSQYTLPQPIEFQDQAVYSISVFHQLHCLHTIMQAYNTLSEHETAPASSHTSTSTRRDDGDHHHHQPPPHQPEHEHTNHNHIDHCFRYLRQSILCCGDTALEGQDMNHPDLKATDGTGAVHLCRDYGALKAWAEGRRVTGREGREGVI
ncbi:hypothetical protein QBC32DRAFT_379236 [Pseudoneurospora amorphoporcata]|uniref:Tat pathway signal sequence n=1 Tax=Pseudoneurospora amorphoporcata TaxID=241081 RepID=A0AAN6SD44_9PEZI|nr:hypothetical protein QBC32DRAFT_379236 [Pseudoneurospora amorphoporcata]